MSLSLIIPFSEAAADTIASSDVVWIDALHPRTYHHPQLGEVPVTEEKLNNFVTNFKNGVRGQEIATDYEHGVTARGTKASGWIKDAAIKDGKLKLAVGFTEPAKQEIKNNEWKYFSVEWLDNYIDSNTGTKYKDVITGGGLTNRPIAKGMDPLPVNFSEFFDVPDDDLAVKFSVWSTAYKNNLPDSSFMYIEPGGTKDSEGKTTPRSLRHLPIKDANGKLDMAHVRAAVSMIPKLQAKGANLGKLQSKARAMLGAMHMSEAGVSSITEEFVEQLVATNPEEFMEPGTYAPDLTPDDDGWDKQWRRDTPPPGFDGSIEDQPSTVTEAKGKESDTMDEKLKEELRKLYALSDDADDDAIIQHVTKEHMQFSELTAAANDLSNRKAFSEAYPEEHRRMVELENSNREAAANLFSERLATSRVTRNEGEGDDIKKVKTRLGLSGAVVEAARETHKKFSEGTATLDDFTKFAESILDSGIVDYGEDGSSVEDGTIGDSGDKNGAIPTNVQDVRTAFAEKVAATQAKNAGANDGKGISFSEATAIAKAENPKLFEAYATQNLNAA